MAPNIEIVLGTYEEFLLGYKVNLKDEKHVLTQSFADKSHSGSIKSVNCLGRWIATGATDDRIFVYDMQSRKQVQMILGHEGSVNALAFTPDGTHLLSGGEDGRMIATRMNTWLPEANWTKAHNSYAVTHISCHPSGKMALSLGTDLILRTWNLVKGRVAYKTNLKSRATLGTTLDCLCWSPLGNFFAIAGRNVVEFWSIKEADVVHTQKTKAKTTSLCWLTEEVCLLGLEDGNVMWVKLKSNDEKQKEFIAHTARVKAMALHSDILVTASSDGELKVWQIDEKKYKAKELASINIGCRPTCISILNLEQFGNDYKLNSELAQVATAPRHTSAKSQKLPQQRGVVTIEYENDDEIEAEKDISDENSESEAESDDDSLPGEDDSSEDLNERDMEQYKECEMESTEDDSAEELPQNKLKRKGTNEKKSNKKVKLSNAKKAKKMPSQSIAAPVTKSHKKNKLKKCGKLSQKSEPATSSKLLQTRKPR